MEKLDLTKEAEDKYQEIACYLSMFVSDTECEHLQVLVDDLLEEVLKPFEDFINIINKYIESYEFMRARCAERDNYDQAHVYNVKARELKDMLNIMKNKEYRDDLYGIYFKDKK